MVDGADGVAPDGDTALNFAIGYDLADPTGSFFGGFGILDESGEFLRGDVIAVGYTENVVEFQFGNLEGAAANEFGASVLMEIMFSDPLGDNPFASFADATLYRAAITVSDVAPIPLPAGLPLLLSALGGAFVLRHTRRS